MRLAAIGDLLDRTNYLIILLNLQKYSWFQLMAHMHALWSFCSCGSMSSQLVTMPCSMGYSRGSFVQLVWGRLYISELTVWKQLMLGVAGVNIKMKCLLRIGIWRGGQADCPLA